jgi:transcriptional regulator with XRE-family HTH domain
MATTLKPAPSSPVREVRGALGISRERMARLLDISAKTVERWEAQGVPPRSTSVRERFAQLSRIAELGRLVYTPEGLARFLTTPLPVFDGRPAMKLLELGEGERVLAALAADYEGLGA